MVNCNLWRNWWIVTGEIGILLLISSIHFKHITNSSTCQELLSFLELVWGGEGCLHFAYAFSSLSIFEVIFKGPRAKFYDLRKMLVISLFSFRQGSFSADKLRIHRFLHIRLKWLVERERCCFDQWWYNRMVMPVPGICFCGEAKTWWKALFIVWQLDIGASFYLNI